MSMGEQRPELTLVVMAYNEAANLDAAVAELYQALQQTGVRFECLIVDDGSTDGTGALADVLAARLTHVRVIHHQPNQGLGGVYRTGYREARGRYLTFFPADGQFPAEIIHQFLPLMAQYELVLGYLPDRRPGLTGQLLSGVERVMYRALFGKFPKFQGIMMFHTEILSRFPLKSDGRGWGVVMELIVRATRSGVKTVSVPTGIRPRMSGESKVNNTRTVWANFKQLLDLRDTIRD